MEIYVRSSPLSAALEALLVVGRFEDEEGLSPALAGLDGEFGGLVARTLEAGEFRGKHGEVRCLSSPTASGALRRLLLLGLGKRAELDLEALRRAIGEAALRARSLRTGELAVAVPLAAGLPSAEQARAAVEAAHLALYEFREYRSKPRGEDDVPVAKLTLVCHEDDDPATFQSAVSLGHLAAESQVLCRDLANTPGLEATPAWMAEKARETAGRWGLSIRIIEREEMEELGMGGLLGVASGSAQPPKLVELTHNADRVDLDTVCLVGKGVTFDSGGLSIKQPENMHLMKFDKCGACVVIATMGAVASLDLPLRVIGLAPLVENMPSGSSYRPGDVLRMMNGKTVEVLNTDAEGRLILADALAFAARCEPDAIIDLATLTGSCVIALGKHCAGLMGSDDGLMGRIEEASRSCGEKVWRLPLGPEYRRQIESEVADMTNLGGKWGGAITAASLLAEFVGDVPWAHLDIAGVSWREDSRDYLRKGGTGFGVRLLIELLRNWSGTKTGENGEG